MADHQYQDVKIPEATNETTGTKYALRQVEKPNAVEASNEPFDRTEAEMELARIDGRIQHLVHALWNSANPPAPKNSSVTVTANNKKAAEDYPVIQISLLQEQLVTAQSQLKKLNAEKAQASEAQALRLVGKIKNKMHHIRHLEKKLLKLEDPEAAHALAVERLTKRIARAEERYEAFQANPNCQQEAENEKRNLYTMRQELKELTEPLELNKTPVKKLLTKAESNQEGEKGKPDHRKKKRIKRIAERTTQSGSLPTAPDLITKVTNEVDRLLQRREEVAQLIEAARIIPAEHATVEHPVEITAVPTTHAQNGATETPSPKVTTVRTQVSTRVAAKGKDDLPPAAKRPRTRTTFETVEPGKLAETIATREAEAAAIETEHACEKAGQKRYPGTSFYNTYGHASDLTPEQSDEWTQRIKGDLKSAYNHAREKHHAR